MNLEKAEKLFWEDGEVGEDCAAWLIQEVKRLTAENAELRTAANDAAVFVRGAEAMRKACQEAMREADESFRTYEESWDEAERLIRALPIPEMKGEES